MADTNELVIESQLGMVLEEEEAITFVDTPCIDTSSIILTETPDTGAYHVSQYIVQPYVTVAGFEEVGEETDLTHSWDSLNSASSEGSSLGQESNGDANPDVFLAFVEDSGPVTLLTTVPSDDDNGEVIVQRMYEMKDDLMLPQAELKDDDYFSEKDSSDSNKTSQVVKVLVKDDKRSIHKVDEDEDYGIIKEEEFRDNILSSPKVKDESESDSERQDDFTSQPFSCSDCNQNFTSSKSFKNHMQAHLIRLQNSCALCNQEFESKSSLQDHIKEHFAKKTAVICEICKKQFMSKTMLKRHKRQIHSSNELLVTSLKCEICNSVFSSKFSLKSHAATHSTRKPFTCKECGATFTQNGSLQVHLRRHRGEKPFKCDICGNNFTRAHSLKVHMKTHTGEKPYNCEYCGACFVTSSHLTVHRRTHTGERPYSCNQCGATFITTSHLNVHRRLHNNHNSVTPITKVIICSLCGENFDDPGKLRYHRRTGHKGSLKKLSGNCYRCKICSKKFATQALYHIHTTQECG